MTKQANNEITFSLDRVDMLESNLMELELRAQAQRAAARALARAIRRTALRIRKFFTGSRTPAAAGDLRSA
jgi:hypothetical protein